MSYRIQFTITDDEYAQLKKEAMEGGFPTVAECAKSKSLNGVNNYADLFKKAVREIASKKIGDEFFVRDLIPNPPALLGRWIYEAVRDMKIKQVKHLGNDGMNPERYKKISLEEWE